MDIKKKLMAIAIVALFCASAVSMVIPTDDDSSAADSENTYTLYFEVINSAYTVASSDWIKFTSEPTNEKFVDNVNAALVKYGYSGIVFTYSSTYIGVQYNSGYNNATFYGNNNSWAAVENTMTDYINHSTIGLALGNAYISQTAYNGLSASEQGKWQYIGWGGDYDYQRILATDPKTDVPGDMTCHYFAEVIDANGKVESSKWIEFTTMKTNSALAVNATAAFKAAGLDKITLKVGTYGVSVLYNDDMNNSCMYADGKTWKAVANTSKDYLNHDIVALSVSHGYIGQSVYDKLSADEKKVWSDTGYGGDYAYQKIVTEATDGYKPASSGSDNTALIIGIVVAVIAVIIIGVAVWFFKFKK